MAPGIAPGPAAPGIPGIPGIAPGLPAAAGFEEGGAGGGGADAPHPTIASPKSPLIHNRTTTDGCFEARTIDVVLISN